MGQAAAESVVSKKHLCEALGWSRMKLDRRLEEDANFPVVRRGAQGEPWTFDLEAVREYLEPEEERDLFEAPPPGGEGAPAPLLVRSELTARQRRDLAQAQLHEDKLRERRGELVSAADVAFALAETVAKVGVSLNAVPDILIRRLGLPESARAVIRQEIDEVRRQMVAGLRDLHTDG